MAIVPIRRPSNFRKKEAQHKINRLITATEVRVVGDNVETKICSIEEALSIASDLGLDLVEINSQVQPPICKVIDYQKYLYEEKKKKKQNDKGKSKLKELSFSPNIGKGDLDVKTRQAKEFLENGDKVKITIKFKGREIVYEEQGKIVLLSMATALENIGKAEALPKLEGKFMTINISPKKK